MKLLLFIAGVSFIANGFMKLFRALARGRGRPASLVLSQTLPHTLDTMSGFRALAMAVLVVSSASSLKLRQPVNVSVPTTMVVLGAQSKEGGQQEERPLIVSIPTSLGTPFCVTVTRTHN